MAVYNRLCTAYWFLRRNNYPIYDIFKSELDIEGECIIGDEGDNFYFTDKIVDELLSITSVHPVKEKVIFEHIDALKIDKPIIADLVDKELIKKYKYQNEWFYRRNL